MDECIEPPAEPSPLARADAAELIERLSALHRGAEPAPAPAADAEAAVLEQLRRLEVRASAAPERQPEDLPPARETNGRQPAEGRSALAEFGVDLTAQARERPPVFFGREEEIETVMEALCRRRKANPLLLGPPGSGKTALVEAVAARIASGQVPPLLRDQRVISIGIGGLVSGGGVVGEIEARVETLLRQASNSDVILFFDELHTLMGAGGKEGTGDVASLIKPALARGDLRCIAATTDDEFHRFIKNDAALERRFLPIRLRELTAQETRHVLAMLRDEDGAAPEAPHVSDLVLDVMVDRMERALPNRHFPDKAIDLFDQVLAHARLRGATEVTVDMVEAVAERMTGIPGSPSVRLERLAGALRDGGWCSDDEVEALAERLSITLRGLDLHTDRPNLVVRVASPSLERVRTFARILAGGLYGDELRVLEIDGGSLTTDAGMTTLIGASAGYVGYGDRYLLAALGDQPCHVVLLHGMEQAHPAVTDLLERAIESGWVNTQRNRRIAFSEAVVLEWDPAERAERVVVGFGRSGQAAPLQKATRDHAKWRVDVEVTIGTGDPVAALLETLSRRWAEAEDIRLVWTPALRIWAASASRGHGDVASFVDRMIAGPLWKLLRGPGASRGAAFELDVNGDALVVTPTVHEGDAHAV